MFLKYSLESMISSFKLSAQALLAPETIITSKYFESMFLIMRYVASSAPRLRPKELCKH